VASFFLLGTVELFFYICMVEKTHKELFALSRPQK